MIADEDRLDYEENVRRYYSTPKQIQVTALISALLGAGFVLIVAGLFGLFEWLFGSVLH